MGAVAIPVGWRQYQKWKAAEILRLETKLAKEQWRMDRLVFGSQLPIGVSAEEIEAILHKNPKYPTLAQSILALRGRLQQLTGVRPGNRESLTGRINKIDLEQLELSE